MKETEPRFFDMRKVLIIRFLLLREILFAQQFAVSVRQRYKKCLKTLLTAEQTFSFG